MKKLLIALAVMTAILGTITIVSASDISYCGNNRNYQCYYYEDNNENGICDNYENQTYNCPGRQNGNRDGKHYKQGRYGK